MHKKMKKKVTLDLTNDKHALQISEDNKLFIIMPLMIE